MPNRYYGYHYYIAIIIIFMIIIIIITYVWVMCTREQVPQGDMSPENMDMDMMVLEVLQWRIQNLQKCLLLHIKWETDI